tara:strand:+ start:1078 stop:1308 length:231 start_codon:yes stop_codon:yes gene_type:complete
MNDLEKENKDLCRGKKVFVSRYDNHCDHILQHTELLYNKNIINKSPKLVEKIMSHIEEHVAEITDIVVVIPNRNIE